VSVVETQRWFASSQLSVVQLNPSLQSLGFETQAPVSLQ
jgi:hypothetical protein